MFFRQRGIIALSAIFLSAGIVIILFLFFGSFFATPKKAEAAATLIFLVSGTSWTVPSDWNSANNTIEVIGGGAGGSGAYAGIGSGSGGGGGGYSKSVNVTLTPGATSTIAIGTGGGQAAAGGDTFFCNSTTNCASILGTAVVVGAKGGASGLAGGGGAGGSGGQAASGIGSTKFTGGSGGSGSTNNSAGGGGGGGAAGLNGVGKNGGAGYAGQNFGAAGGGGANNGTSGSDPLSSAGAVGGNGNGGSGGGAGGGVDANGTNGTNGGGGGGAGFCSSGFTCNGGIGGSDTGFDSTHGSGGGGGGAGSRSGSFIGGSGGTGGLYGGGGAGTARGTGGGGFDGSGAAGVIVIAYTPLVSVPGTPGTPTFTSVAATTMRANWSAASGATSYKVERCSGVSCSTFTQIAAGVTTLFYDDSALTANTSYTYRIRGTNATGDGAYSGNGTQVTAVIPAPTCTISPASQTISSGGTAAINYTITGSATTADINGVSVSTASPGTYSPSPLSTTNYTMTVTNASGSNTCGPITVTINASCTGNGVGTPITGYAWSDTTGWIDLNCSNSGICATRNFGLAVAVDGTVTGNAWSENIGWVSANSCDLGGCPSGSCTANISTNAFTGWLRAIAGSTSQSGGWDGFISLSGAGYGITYNSSGQFGGYAWGSTNVGWVDFSKAQSTYNNACTPSTVYTCSGSQTVVKTDTNISCQQTITNTSCTVPQFCSAGSPTCLWPQIYDVGGLAGQLTAKPSLVRKNATSTISWNIGNASSCSVTGTNGDSWTGLSAAASNCTHVPSGCWSSPIPQQTFYTLSCTPLDTSKPQYIENATVNILPDYQEK